jgi:hypothetical protein
MIFPPGYLLLLGLLGLDRQIQAIREKKRTFSAKADFRAAGSVDPARAQVVTAIFDLKPPGFLAGHSLHGPI